MTGMTKCFNIREFISWQFDDKGKPVTPTAEQLQAMKGDAKLPGYAAEVRDGRGP